MYDDWAVVYMEETRRGAVEAKAEMQRELAASFAVVEAPVTE